MFSENEHEALDITSIVFNSLSLCSSLWVFYLYIKSPSPCNAQFKMLVNLTLSDFLIAVTGFVTHFSPKNDRTCSLFVFLSLVSYWSSAYWSSIVAIFSYKKIATSSDFNSNKFYNHSVLLWIVLCVILPMMPIFGLFGSQYISHGEYCAISFTSNPILLFMVSEGLPIFIALFVTAVSYIKQIQALKNLPDFILSRINISTGKLFWYSVAQCLVFIPGLVCQLVYLLTPCNSIIFHAIRLYGFRLAGFVNSIVYGFQRIKLRKSQDCWSGSATRTESLLATDCGESYVEYEDDVNETKEDLEEYICH